ncbi:MAG: hypothetical protein Q9208_000791 [Pyrenodesmia sp. 3 TL-2023]
MPSLLVVVFILQILIHLVNTVGANAINELLWTLYNKLPTPTHNSVQESNRLRTEVLRLKREMNATSSQDEFAKWAKLRRQHDKAVAQYDEKANSLKSFRSSFIQAATALRWLGTNGLRFFLQFWFARRPMFWIPAGWMPGYVEFLMAFPRAPRGSVSIQIWGIACATVVQMVGAAVAAALVLVKQRRDGAGREKEKTGMKVDSGGRAREKKDL